MSDSIEAGSDAEGLLMAHDIAAQLADHGLEAPDGITVLGMALGIFLDSQNLDQHHVTITDAVSRVAEQTIAVLRAHRVSAVGHA